MTLFSNFLLVLKFKEHIKKVKIDLGYILETHYAIFDLNLGLKNN